jgi:1,4-dihydroxy-2-naphthoate octaprenyltransferase
MREQPSTSGALAADRPSSWKALNPAIYLVSVLPGVGVALLAHQDIGWAGLVAATFAVVLLQHAINLFNDVSDWRLGADVEKHDSWVRAHGGDLRMATLHGALSAVAGILLGVATLVLADKLWILLVATPMVMLGYLYNAGERPLSYTSLGEWVTGLCYGPGVFGCLYLLAYGSVDLPGAIGMLTFGALAMALLLSHQPPQIATDRAAGKHSFAVRYGRDMTVRVAWGLYLLALFSFALAAHLAGQSLVLGAFLGCAILVLLLSLPKSPNPRLFMLGANGAFSATLVIALLFRG